MVIQPRDFVPGLSISVDYYHIDIDDRIMLSSNYVDAAGSPVAA